MSENMIERLARAIYDAEDPNSGDSIATTIHLSEHIPPEGTIEEQLEQVMKTCRAAARAVLGALREPTSEMRLAGIEACPLVSREHWPNGQLKGVRRSLDTDEVGELFAAMIDAALRTEGE